VTVPALPGEPSYIDKRWGAGFELVLRVAIIAERGCCTGLDVSELRRLSGYSEDVTPSQIKDVGEDDPLRGLVLLICDAERTCRSWEMIRAHQEALRFRVDRALEDYGMKPVFLTSEEPGNEQG